MSEEKENTLIYHLVPLAEVATCLDPVCYQSTRLPVDGFVHCAGSQETTVAVANDYFSQLASELVVFAIATTALTAPVKVEAPAPLPTSTGETRFQTTKLFPHVYGPIDRAAIQGVAILPRQDGSYSWPSKFVSLAELLESP